MYICICIYIYIYMHTPMNAVCIYLFQTIRSHDPPWPRLAQAVKLRAEGRLLGFIVPSSGR